MVNNRDSCSDGSDEDDDVDHDEEEECYNDPGRDLFGEEDECDEEQDYRCEKIKSSAYKPKNQEKKKKAINFSRGAIKESRDIMEAYSQAKKKARLGFETI